MQFYQLAIGAKFSAHGQRFRKTAMSMASDGKIGHVIHAATEIEPDGGQPVRLTRAGSPKIARTRPAPLSLETSHQFSSGVVGR
jgi:hypothetical protein